MWTPPHLRPRQKCLDCPETFPSSKCKKRCADCQKKHRCAKRVPEKGHEKPCAFCSKYFLGRRDRTFCSDACNKAYFKAWLENTKWTCARALEQRRAALPFCSCGKKLSFQNAKRCRACTQEWENGGRLEAGRTKWAALRVTCRLCSATFTPEYKPSGRMNSVGKIGKYCHDCRQIGSRILKFGVAYEYVNSQNVFERDGWKCQHCGCDTPERLKGAARDNAPTVDHILPISRGGAHSYFNTQCLCRKCNSRKSAKMDPKLVGVADLSPYRKARNPGKWTPVEPRLCNCGCGALYTPRLDGNAEYKKGHWRRKLEHRAQTAGLAAIRRARKATRPLLLPTTNAWLVEAQRDMRERLAAV